MTQTTSTPEAPLAVEMRGIVKKFPGVLANDHVDFELRTGEIHALLGENGAGKSTLMNVLAGLYRQEAGIIKVKGKPVDFYSPRDAIKSGIGMIHQHFMLVPSQTVTENVLLGLDDPRFFMRLPEYDAKVAAVAMIRPFTPASGWSKLPWGSGVSVASRLTISIQGGIEFLALPS